MAKEWPTRLWLLEPGSQVNEVGIHEQAAVQDARSSQQRELEAGRQPKGWLHTRQLVR